MSLQSDLKHEQAIAGYKGQYQANVQEGWKEKVRWSEAWKKTQTVKADTQEIKLEIASEQKAIAQNDLSYTRQMGIVKGETQKVKLQIAEFKLNGKTSVGDSFKAEAAKSVKKSKTAALV